MSSTPVFWALIPAAGAGRRFGSVVPKQYLTLAGRMVIDHALELFTSHPACRGVVVAVDDNDALFAQSAYADHPAVHRVRGGAERYLSVACGLDALVGLAAADDWVLVHDAARPCLRVEDLNALLAELADNPPGALLGAKVRDTMKRADADGHISATVDREGLWHAFTPQACRLSLLKRALEQARADGYAVTDEASAIEHLGLTPRMVEGHADNLKITRPEDLPLAEFYLAARGDS